VAELERYKVSQSNRLVEGSYTLTLNEKRLILCACSLLDSRKEHSGHVTIRAEDYANVFGIDVKHAYSQIAEAAGRLWEREIAHYNDEGVFVSGLRWIYSRAYYLKGQGAVELKFSPDVMPQLSMLSRDFTTIQLKQIGSLNSFYAVRLYELMAQYVKLKKRRCAINQLREFFDIGEKYSNVKDFRRWVLDPSVSELNKHTDLSVEVEPMREGRKIVGFDFTINKNAQIPLSL
jgi:plasmid replication initiation protein